LLANWVPARVTGHGASTRSILDLPAQKLAELVEPRAQSVTPLEEAAAQFAARVSEADSPRPAKSSALRDFVRVLAGG
jgi:hypothetical protein